MQDMYVFRTIIFVVLTLHSLSDLVWAANSGVALLTNS